METHYTILEIQDTATPEEIKDSYRLLMQVWHPDRFHHRRALLAKAEEKSGKINVAFDTLSDPVLKQRYDDWLRASGGRSTKTVESVTCPSCHTTLLPPTEHSQGWEPYDRRHRAAGERTRPPGRDTGDRVLDHYRPCRRDTESRGGVLERLRRGLAAQPGMPGDPTVDDDREGVREARGGKNRGCVLRARHQRHRDAPPAHPVTARAVAPTAATAASSRHRANWD